MFKRKKFKIIVLWIQFNILYYVPMVINIKKVLHNYLYLNQGTSIVILKKSVMYNMYL